MNKYKLTTYFINVTGTCVGDEDTDTVSWTQQHPVLEIYQLFWGSEKLALLDIGITEGKGIVYIHPAVLQPAQIVLRAGCPYKRGKTAVLRAGFVHIYPAVTADYVRVYLFQTHGTHALCLI